MACHRGHVTLWSEPSVSQQDKDVFPTAQAQRTLRQSSARELKG